VNLIEAQRKVEEKDKERNKLLGEKGVFVDNLKKLGFKTIGEAKKQKTALINETTKMKKHYQNGEAKFINKFGHL